MRDEEDAKEEYYNRAVNRLKTVGRFGSPKKAPKDLHPPNYTCSRSSGR